jgi:O-antigen/teichoic acid export membrane protein
MSPSEQPAAPAVPPRNGRNESEAERIDRNVAELLQELRVAGLGVQVLFGFLLAMPFTNLFSSLDPEQDRLYVAVLLLAALSTALLTAPVAYHRIVFRRHKKHDLLRFANAVALAGLVTVALAICGAVLLVVSVVYDGLVAAIIAAVVAGVYFVLWYVVPHLSRRDTDY